MMLFHRLQKLIIATRPAQEILQVRRLNMSDRTGNYVSCVSPERNGPSLVSGRPAITRGI